jgi:large repetitive protein
VVPPRGSAVVQVDAIDPDGDRLFFRYSAESGAVTADPSNPALATYVDRGSTAESDRLTVTVTDARNTSTTATRTVPLQGNRRPVVSVQPAVEGCHPPCRVTFIAEASDPEGEELSYAWSGCASGNEASAPCQVEHPGTISAAVTVTDGQGGVTTVVATAEGTNRAPTIRGVQDAPAGEPRLLVSENDADGDRMVCGWWGDCRCTGSHQSFNLLCTIPSFQSTCFQRFACTDPFGATGEFTFTLR